MDLSFIPALMPALSALVTQVGFPVAIAIYYIYKDYKQSGVVASTLGQLATIREIESKTFQQVVDTLKDLVNNEEQRDEKISQILKSVTENNAILKVK